MTNDFQSTGILTHFDASGQAHMVDVGQKSNTARLARARGAILMQAPTLALIAEGRAGKGDVLALARVAGIMAAKKTSEIIPLCHPIALTHMAIDFQLCENFSGFDDLDNPNHDLLKYSENHQNPPHSTAAVICTATAQTVSATGVEMEAMVAASAALLTIYDMCKAAERGMEISQIHLLEKMGGKSGHWRRDNESENIV